MDHEVPKLDPGFTQELRKLLTERDAHCPRCGYSLSGVPGPRCPECGKNVSYELRVADTTPWRLPEMRRRAAVRSVVHGLTFGAAIFGAAGCVLYALVNLCS